MDWELKTQELLNERNNIQTKNYLDVYSAYKIMERKCRFIKKKHIEIRNRIGMLQYEIQESLYTKSVNLEEIKMKLSVIADDLSPRTTKEYDDIKIRLELTRKIKEQEYLIDDLKSETKAAKSQLSMFIEQIANLQEEISKKEAISQTLKLELEGTRGYLVSAENKLKSVEAENIQYAQRLFDEKQKNTQLINEINKLTQQSPSTAVNGIIGESFNLMKKFGATSLFSKTQDNTNKQIHEDDIEDDFVDVKNSTSTQTGIASSKVEQGDDFPDNFPLDESIPPRKALYYIKCHNSEINDIVYNKQKFMTGGSDSFVKIFERKGSGQSPDIQISDDTPPQESLSSLQAGGPIISLDLKGDWIAAGCSDGIGRIWSVKTGRLRHNLSGHSNRVNSIRLVGTGEERAVTGSADRILRFWDILRSQPQIVCNMKVNSCINCVDIYSDCNTVASGHQDGGLRLWNMFTKDKIHSIPKLHTTHITSVSFDPRRNYQILTASRDNTLTIIDTRTYEPLMILRAPGFSLTSDWSQVSFSPDASYVAAGGSNGSLFLWSTISGDLLQSIPGNRVSIVSTYWGDSGVLTCDRQGGIIQWE